MHEVPIETVIFDVGKVLFEWDLRHLFRKLCANEAEIERIVGEVVTPEWHFQHDAGRPLAEMVAERTAAFPADAAMIAAWATRFNETIPGPVPGSLEIVAALAAHGVPMFAITNFGAEFWAGFRPTQPVFNHFRDIIVSGEERLMKPDPAIYALAIRRFGLDPGRALFIDDRADNVASARAAGMRGHEFASADRMHSELAAYGLIARHPDDAAGKIAG